MNARLAVRYVVLEGRWCQVHLARTVVPALIVAGCASGSSPSTTSTRPSGPPTREIYTGDGAHLLLASESYMVETDIGAPAMEVWQAATEAYRKLGIEITLSEPGERVGSRQLRVRRDLDGSRLSRFFRCGVDATGRPNADRYTMTINVVSEVVPLSDLQSRLQTTVTATARTPTGQSNDPVMCTSKGLLEERIADSVLENT